MAPCMMGNNSTLLYQLTRNCSYSRSVVIMYLPIFVSTGICNYGNYLGVAYDYYVLLTHCTVQLK